MNKDQIATLIADYFRREIGRLMQQAEHWAAHDRPFAAHHRVMKADAYYQVVSLFGRHGKFEQDTFEIMQVELGAPEIKPPGVYPPSAELSRYRDPAYVAARASGEQASPNLADVYVPGAWRCPKCAFTLHQANLNASDGSVTARDEPGDKCPNCNKPLWRVTWKEQANEMALRCEKLMEWRRAPVDPAEVERHPGPWTGPDAEFAQACAMAAIKDYGDEDPEVLQRILRDGVWNDHVAVQAALAAIHTLRKSLV